MKYGGNSINCGDFVICFCIFFKEKQRHIDKIEMINSNNKIYLINKISAEALITI